MGDQRRSLSRAGKRRKLRLYYKRKEARRLSSLNLRPVSRSNLCKTCLPANALLHGRRHSLAQRRQTTGPIVPKAVLADKVSDPNVYSDLEVFVDDACPVCLEEWHSNNMCSRAVVLACKHPICLTCMTDWLNRSNCGECPACRLPISLELSHAVRQGA